MADKRNADVLRSLPRTRPHRRSEKRGARANDPAPAAVTPARTAPHESRPATKAQNGAARAKSTTNGSSAKRPAAAPTPVASRAAKRPKATTIRQPAQPAGAPPGRRVNPPADPKRPDLLGTAVQAAAELAEIGLSVGAQAIRQAVSRLPKP